MEVTESEDMPLILQSTPPQSEPTDGAVEKVIDSEDLPPPQPPQVIVIDSESAPPTPSRVKVIDSETVPQPSTSQVEDEGKQEDTKRIKKMMGGQILKLLGHVVICVKSMSEDIGVLNSKIDKIAETSCLHYKPTDVKTEPPFGGAVSRR